MPPTPESHSSQSGRKVTTHSLQQMKEEGVPIAALTAYDYLMAEMVDRAGIEQRLDHLTPSGLCHLHDVLEERALVDRRRLVRHSHRRRAREEQLQRREQVVTRPRKRLRARPKGEAAAA